VVAEWSKVKNWAYVVLSRVRSLAGLTTWDRNRLPLRMLLARHKACLLQFASVEIPLKGPRYTEVHTAASSNKVREDIAVITPKRSINLLLVLAWDDN
jgi:hypothetical protein